MSSQRDARSAQPDAPQSARHSFEEHTGDVKVLVIAPSMEELFAQAGRSLAELMTGQAQPRDGDVGTVEKITVEAPDRDALLVEWLNELIFRSEVEKAIFVDIRVIETSDTRLVANATPLYGQTLKTAVKAATLHGLHIEEASDGCCTASVVLDV